MLDVTLDVYGGREVRRRRRGGGRLRGRVRKGEGAFEGEGIFQADKRRCRGGSISMYFIPGVSRHIIQDNEGFDALVSGLLCTSCMLLRPKSIKRSQSTVLGPGRES